MVKWIVISIIVFLGIWIGTAYAAVMLREKKGHEKRWGLCLLFGIISLIYAAGLPDMILRKSIKEQIEAKPRFLIQNTSKELESKETSTKKEANDPKRIEKHQWRCANCGQLISEEECPFCGYQTK